MLASHFLSHRLDPTGFHALVEAAYDTYRRRLPSANISLAWHGASEARVHFQVAGFTLSGNVLFTADTLQFGLDFPLVFRPLQKRALRVLDQEARAWIARAEAGEFSPASTTEEGAMNVRKSKPGL